MDHGAVQPALTDNFLLYRLSAADLAWLQPRLSLLQCPLNFTFYLRAQPISHVYFPATAIGSALARLQTGEAVEAGTIGREGLIGLEVFLGGRIGLLDNVCQVPGMAFQMTVDDFTLALATLPGLHKSMQLFTLAYLAQASQSVACNRLHSLEERCARWLLMTHDRAGSDVFALTQEHLAIMLGVHRPSVSLVAGMLQKAGTIRYRRGSIEVLDRQGLESASCECYEIVRKQFDRLLDQHKPGA